MSDTVNKADAFLMTTLYGGTSIETQLDSDPGGEELLANPIEKFVENAQLEAALGRNGHQHVERFAEETLGLDQRVRQIHSQRSQKAAGASERLEKRAAPGNLIEKRSPNGRWIYAFNERGELVSGREVE